MPSRSRLFAAAPLVAALLGACAGAEKPKPVSATATATASATATATASESASATASARGRCERRHSDAAAPEAVSRRSSSVVWAARTGEALVYVADADRRAIHTVNVDSRALVATTKLDAAPAQLIVLADGRVVVAEREGNRVAVLEPTSDSSRPLEMLCAVDVPSEPFALAVSPDESTIFVTSAWGRALTALDEKSLETRYSVRLPREPRAVLVEPSGKRAFVSHAVGDAMSIIDLVGEGHAVRPLDMRIGLTEDGKNRAAGQGFALAALAKTNEKGEESWTRILAPAVSVDRAAGSVSSEVYGSRSLAVAPLVAVVDAGAEALMERELRGAEDLSDLGGPAAACTLPRAAETVGGDRLLVACLGIDAVLELDARARNPMDFELRRFRVPAGPVGIAVEPSENRAFVWSAFAGELGVIDLRDDGKDQAISISLAAAGPSGLSAAEARGRILFHATNDPRISGDGRACESCHVDGREDGLTWTTPEGPHQTIMLAGRLSSDAPFGWRGETRTLRHHVGRTMKRLAGRGIWGPEDSADLDALITWLKVMPAPVNTRADEARAALVAKGKTIFEDGRQGCATCHPGGGSDNAAWDVARSPFRIPFDTPSLRFVGGTAPYFHDGRHATLGDLLRGSDGAMGHTGGLSQDEMAALEAYLEDL